MHKFVQQIRLRHCCVVWATLLSVLIFAAGPSRAADCDLETGAQVYQRCSACHSLTKDAHGVGPSLHGILGQSAGKQDGFLFSTALAALEIVWDAETLSAFLENPMAYVPGSVMPFAGIRRTEERAALICWLAAQPADE